MSWFLARAETIYLEQSLGEDLKTVLKRGVVEINARVFTKKSKRINGKTRGRRVDG
jgi:hypothetical protein